MLPLPLLLIEINTQFVALCSDSNKFKCTGEQSQKDGCHRGQLICMSVLQHEVCQLFPAEVSHGDSQRRAGNIGEIVSRNCCEILILL